MLELSKEILSKVSFDKNLFKKELSKSIRWLSRKEILTLKIYLVIWTSLATEMP